MRLQGGDGEVPGRARASTAPTDQAIGLAATLGFPNARTGAVAVAAPRPSAVRARKATLADRALVAGADAHNHGAVLADLAGDVDGRGSRIAEIAVGDADRIAIRRIALTALGHDHHAPEAVIARLGLGARKRGKRGRASERGGDQAAGENSEVSHCSPFLFSCRAPPP